MKLGTLKAKSRDGELVVVSRDNKKAVRAETVVATMQQALDCWSEVEAPLKKLYDSLNEGTVSGAFGVKIEEFHSPLPRAYQFVDGSAYIQHIKLVRKARGAEPPETLETIPLMYQGCSDSFLAPTQDIPLVDESHGLDFEGEVAIVTDDVPQGTSEEEAANHIKLLMLCNDISLRGLIPAELALGFGFLQSKPSSSFSPFAITPDELGSAWRDSRVHLNLDSRLNGKFFGNPGAGDMFFSFAKLVSHAARTRNLAAGSIVGSGTVSNEDESRGSSCLAEKRMLEKIKTGNISTPFMRVGDCIEMEMKNEAGENLFGTISQKVTLARVAH